MFSLYIHLPYCERKCPYCDFNAYGVATWPEDRYTDALLLELRHFGNLDPWSRQKVATIFFGGGTPSLFAPESIGRILAGVGDCFGITPGAEITLEANPGTVCREKLEGLRTAGINRMSFGVQSFHDRHLSTLGRIHGGEQALTALEVARDVGFDAINIDLIFGVPGQSTTDWIADIRAALTFDPGHISAYNLTYEKGTAFHTWRADGRLQPADEDVEVDMYAEARTLFGTAGYEHYEISNYARPGRACRHNLRYWRRQPYLGIGAGAHSFAPTPPHGHRWANVRAPEVYMQIAAQQGHATAMNELLTEDQAIAEFFLLGLRVLDGVASDRFTTLFGTPPERARPVLRSLLDTGLLEVTRTGVRLTATGLLQADSVFAALT